MEGWALTTGADPARTLLEDGFAVIPFASRCGEILGRRRHIMLGISPGNGYFCEQRLTAMVRWAARRFERVDLITAHTEMAMCTYLGRGYEPKHARARAYRDVRQMTNRIRRSVAASQANVGQVAVRYMNDAFDSAAYLRARREIARAQREHPLLERTLTAMVTDALRGQMPPDWRPSADELSAGREYLEMELPYLMDTPGLLGVEESLFAYRVVPACAPFLYGPDACLPVSPGQGFITVQDPPTRDACTGGTAA